MIAHFIADALSWIARLIQAHIKVEELIRRCLNSANTFWNQHAHELPWPLHQQREMYSLGGLARHSRSPMTDAPLGGTDLGVSSLTFAAQRQQMLHATALQLAKHALAPNGC